jgi:membrane protein DedA with SNARE-associated domain
MLELLYYIVEFVKTFGYLGIFIMTFVESTFIPLPAEITMIPAGYLISKGAMNFWLVFFFSVSGAVLGSWLNYWIAKHYGRKLIINYGKYFFMNKQKLDKIEEYFKVHGPISTFTGRLIPGLRHYISFPAGLAKMNLKLFLYYTGLGGGLWMTCLLLIGYFIGANEDLVHEYLFYLQIGLLVFVVLMVVWYVFVYRRKNTKK